MAKQPTVGLIELDGLATVLHDAGCEVVAGGTPYIFTQIRDMMERGHRVDVVILADRPGHGGGRRAWVEAMAARTQVIVVRTAGGTPQIFRGPVVEVDPPLTVGELAEAANFELPNPAAVAGARITADGTVAVDEDEQARAPGASPWGATFLEDTATPPPELARTAPAPPAWSAPPPAIAPNDAPPTQVPARPAGTAATPWATPPVSAPTPAQHSPNLPRVDRQPAPSPSTPWDAQTAPASADSSGGAEPTPASHHPRPGPGRPGTDEAARGYPSGRTPPADDLRPTGPGSHLDGPDPDQNPPPRAINPMAALDLAEGRHFVSPAGRPVPVRTSKAPVLYVIGAKGGVGKTTLSLHIAAAAAEAGRRVVLVDANRGQGDIARYLHLDHDTNRGLPSIRDVAGGADPVSAITSPERLSSSRDAQLEPVRFAVVLAPRTAKDADPDIVTADVYETAIDAARRLAAADGAGLVVVDTQTLDNDERRGLTKLIRSNLADDAWGLMVSDMSIASVDNTYWHLRALQQAGVRPGRMLLGFNRVYPEHQPADKEALEALFKEYATCIGFGFSVPELTPAMNVGKLLPEHPAMGPLLRDTLWSITSDSEFNPASRGRTTGPVGSLLRTVRRRRAR